jgi:gluconate 2-dehydrogenase gamma chain
MLPDIVWRCLLAAARLSRRHILTAALLGGTALLATSSGARILGGGVPWVPGSAPGPRGFDGARFLTDAERRTVDALVARLIPSDDTGPGALDAGVTDFIDNQLAGSYGRGERWYMQGPFAKGLKTQGYQSAQAPAALYRDAIAALDAHCRETAGGKAFAELSPEEQDAVLTQLEEGGIEFEGVSASAFFSLLQDNAIEGFFCDPIYGGNRDMVGWKLVGFPGARYDYRPHLDHDGARIDIEPVSLAGRPAWNVTR